MLLISSHRAARIRAALFFGAHGGAHTGCAALAEAAHARRQMIGRDQHERAEQSAADRDAIALLRWRPPVGLRLPPHLPVIQEHDKLPRPADAAEP